MLNSVAVKDYMAASLVTFKPSMDVLEAIHKLLENGISGAPVVDNLGNLVGMLSEKDCLKVALEASYNEGYGGTVQDYMTAEVITVDASTSVLDVAQMFIKAPYKRYPVVDDNRLVGQISRSDVLRAFETIRKS
ncbi:MAG: CBS domain-containing protein [Nevskiales bacterium]